jgi:RNA polymerase sigma factor (sigma-70 family)
MNRIAAKRRERELFPLVRWATKVALAWARRGLDEDELIRTALFAFYRALQRRGDEAVLTVDARGVPVDEIVRRAIFGALHEESRRQRKRRRREVLVDDLVAGQGPVGIDDDELLARASGVEALALGAPSPLDSLLRSEAQAHLDAEVARLSPADQRLYDLRHRQELTWDEISARTGVPDSTVRLHAQRTRDRLAAALWALETEW